MVEEGRRWVSKQSSAQSLVSPRSQEAIAGEERVLAFEHSMISIAICFTRRLLVARTLRRGADCAKVCPLRLSRPSPTAGSVRRVEEEPPIRAEGQGIASDLGEPGTSDSIMKSSRETVESRLRSVRELPTLITRLFPMAARRIASQNGKAAGGHDGVLESA